MGAVQKVVLAVRSKEVGCSASDDGRTRCSAIALPNPGPEFHSVSATTPSLVGDWIRLIHQTWSRGPQSVLELAHLMNKARQNLPYGAWSRLWQSSALPFSKRKGEKLVVIGQGLEGLDANNCSHLPAAWSTLYWLAHLGRGLVERLIQEGRIHPGLSSGEARSLLAEYQPATTQKTGRSKLQIRLARFAAFVRADLRNWSTEEGRWAADRLQSLVTQIQQAENLFDQDDKDSSLAISIL